MQSRCCNYGDNYYDKQNKTCYGCRLVYHGKTDSYWEYVRRMRMYKKAQAPVADRVELFIISADVEEPTSEKLYMDCNITYEGN